jgi:hypothetical protein
MSASTSRTAGAERASLGAVLRERNIWLLFGLGFGTGYPFSSYWLDVFPRVDVAVDAALLLVVVSFGVGGWIGLAAAPFLDRHRAPLLARLGHRRSWVALTLSAALVLFALHIATAIASEGAALRLSAISGVPALLIWAFLWISIDALRIELFRGRAQAVAAAAQYLGTLLAWVVAARLAPDKIDLSSAVGFALLLALALGAVLLIKEPPTVSVGGEALPSTIPGTLARPWSTFFARHGRASVFLLCAIACYALAGSAADYLGRQGYVIDLLRSSQIDIDLDGPRAPPSGSPQEFAFSALGAAIGLLMAFRRAPYRAFFLLLYATLGLLGFFALCKAALGFTVFTVAGLFVLRTLIYGASYVIFATVAARLTAGPDTAGQYAILALFVGVFWLSAVGVGLLGSLVGSYAVAAGAAVAGIAALLLLRAAARISQRAGN